MVGLVAHLHRGDPRVALLQALESGAERVELDLLVLDGTLVVAHDHQAARRWPILTAEEALGEIAGAGRALLADLKDGAVPPLLPPALLRAGLDSQTLVSGGRLDELTRSVAGTAARRAWTVPAGPQPGSPVPDGAPAGPWNAATPAARRRVARAAAAALAAGACEGLSVDRRFVTGTLVRAARAHGAPLLGWTAHTHAHVARLARAGVSEITAEHPLAARATLRALDLETEAPAHPPS